MPLKLHDIRSLSGEELKAKYNSLTQDLYGLRQQARMGKLEKPDKIRQIKKDIARLLTVLREKDTKI